MKNYFKSHTLWKVFGAKTRKEYLEKYVIEGRFHSEVPEDVVEAYITAEYIMAHAYYHWAMYDEAPNKIYRIFEMAVKLRAKEKNIPIERPNRRGRMIKKTLNDLIEEVCQGEHLSSLKKDLHRARKFRNWQMHPDSNSFMGAMGGIVGNIRLFVNMLNQLFLDDTLLQNQYQQSLEIRQHIENLNQKVLVLDNGQEQHLTNGILRFKNVNNFLFLSCEPVLLDAYDELSNHRYPQPLNCTFVDFKISENKIEGKSVDNSTVKIFTTDKAENINTLENYQKELDRLDKIEETFFPFHIKGEAGWAIEKLIYKHTMEIYK